MLSRFFENKFPNFHFYHISSDPAGFDKDLASIEQKHPQKKDAMKVAILYAQADQQSAHQMFANKSPSLAFQNFLSILASIIDLSKWQGYRGDMGREGKTYYTKWNAIDCEHAWNITQHPILAHSL